MGSKDGYKLRREAYSAAAHESHAMFCYFFGKPYEPLSEIRHRLDAQLRAHTINQMKREIDEINEGEKG